MSAQGAASDLAALQARIWERGRDEVTRRLQTVEQAVAGVLRDQLEATTRAQAEHEAHKLAGSLGMLGLPQGSALAREIEQALAGDAVLPASQGPSLAAKALLLRRELEGAGPQRPVGDAAPATSPAVVSEAPPEPVTAADPQGPSAADTRLLAIDDDPLVLELLGGLLRSQGIDVTALSDPTGFWPALEEEAPHVVVLDLEMPEVSGIELCRALRADERFAKVPVIFLTAHRDPDVVQRVFEAGADDYVSKPIVGPELLTRIANRLERVRLYRELADRDPLTGVLNRRSATEALERYLRLSERYGEPLSLAMLDVDHFKAVNDRHGHLIGDAVLRRLGELMLASFRSEDVVARWGGEEFAIGMYGATREDAVRRVAELLDEFAQSDVSDGHRGVTGITFTAGIAQSGLDGDDFELLYGSADEALLTGKAAGRRRVVAAGELTETTRELAPRT